MHAAAMMLAVVLADAVSMALSVAVCVRFIVMAAMHGRVVGKLAGEEILYGRIGVATHAAVQRDARRRERLLSTAADTATDQRIDAMLFQESRERAVSLPVRIDDFR